MAVWATVYGGFDTPVVDVLLDGIIAVLVAVADVVFGAVMGVMKEVGEDMVWPVAEAIWEAVLRTVSEAVLFI